MPDDIQPDDETDYDTPVVRFETLALWYEGWLERKSEFDTTPALQAKRKLVAEWHYWLEVTSKKRAQVVAGTIRYTTERCLAMVMQGDRAEFVRGWEKHWDEVLEEAAAFSSSLGS